MSYGIFILGPSGSGKSTLTYCLQHIYSQLKVPITLVNLDSANEMTNKYKADIDINELVRV
jgi:GTPase SAR1 family protein